MMPDIRRLHEGDIESVLAIRREALETDPSAFSASPETDVGLDPEFIREAMNQTSLQGFFGAFADGEIVGMTGVHPLTREKERHKAVLWGMYVRPSSRDAGVGRALLAEAIRFAKSLSGVTHLQLSVSEPALAALHLYQAAGFSTWGIEPASLQVGGAFIAVRHMVLEVDEDKE